MNSLRRARRTVAWFRTGSARSAHWAMLLGIVAPSRAPAHPQTAQLCAVRAAEFQKFIKAERAVRETSAAQVRIACPREAPRPTIFLAYPSEYPPDTFYDFLAAVVGRASQQSAEQTRLRAHRCHRQARRTSFGRAVKVFELLPPGMRTSSQPIELYFRLARYGIGTVAARRAGSSGNFEVLKRATKGYVSDTEEHTARDQRARSEQEPRLPVNAPFTYKQLDRVHVDLGSRR